MILRMLSLLTSLFKGILGLSGAGKFPPPLSAVEESAAFAALAAGDPKAREKLIVHNLRLVSHIVRKYYAASPMSEDLVSIGTIGLIKAVDTFRPSVGARFATYAARCIRNEILMFFRSSKKTAPTVSLGETIDVDRDGNPLTIGDVICSDENVSEETERKMRGEQAMALMNTLLCDREREILTLRFGLTGGEPMPQREIAATLGISRSYVSRIEKAALSKLAEAMGVSSSPNIL